MQKAFRQDAVKSLDIQIHKLPTFTYSENRSKKALNQHRNLSFYCNNSNNDNPGILL